MFFWITAILIALVASVLLGAAVLKGGKTPQPQAASDLKVYKDQLNEVQRDLERGVLGEAEAERAKTEISRRILAADAKLAEEVQTTGNKAVQMTAVVGATVFVFAASFGLYTKLGSAGQGDLAMRDRLEAAFQSLANRTPQAVLDSNFQNTNQTPDENYTALVGQLRDAVKNNPEDERGWELLVRSEGNLGNYPAAHAAQTKLIELRGAQATSGDFIVLADLMIRAGNGEISPEADSALANALELDPGNGFALYYTGLMLRQNGRPDMAFRVWRQLYERSAPSDPWVPAIRNEIDELAWLAGVKYQAPDLEAPAPAAPQLRGPTSEDVEAAQDLSAEDRAAMIEGMVAGLAERLDTEGGSPQEWARLIAAYGVLGKPDEAQETFDAAQEVFADQPEILSMLQSAAQSAGLQN